MPPRDRIGIMAGDLRTPSVKLSYSPDFDICIVVSPVSALDASEIARIPALAIKLRDSLTAYHNVRRHPLASVDNLVERG